MAIDEYWHRQITAQNSAHGILITMLLRLVLRDLTDADAKRVGEKIKSTFQDTSFLEGVFVDDEANAERIADITVQMQMHIGDLIDQAVGAGPDILARRR
ncbi:MAG TPA: hypothetical protein VI199_13150 [Novosphingobium sp.]